MIIKLSSKNWIIAKKDTIRTIGHAMDIAHKSYAEKFGSDDPLVKEFRDYANKTISALFKSGYYD